MRGCLLAQISIIESESVAYLPPQALTYLENGLKQSPTSDLMLNELIDLAKNGIGDIILVTITGKVAGAAYFQVGEGYGGKILGIVTLGGDKFLEWKPQIYDFAKEFSKNRGCNQIVLITREGWGKIFPDLQPIGTVYKLEV